MGTLPMTLAFSVTKTIGSLIVIKQEWTCSKVAYGENVNGVGNPFFEASNKYFIRSD